MTRTAVAAPAERPSWDAIFATLDAMPPDAIRAVAAHLTELTDTSGAWVRWPGAVDFDADAVRIRFVGNELQVWVPNISGQSPA